VKASVVVQEKDKEDSIIMEDVQFMTPFWATSGPFGLLRNDVDAIEYYSTILLGLDRDGKPEGTGKASRAAQCNGRLPR
jgi:hypothetical protein